MDVRIADDAAGAAVLAAEVVARRLRDAVRRRGRASIAVSGGSTPAAMFDALAALAVPWSDVIVLQVDERVAPDGDPDRNAVQLQAHLVAAVGLRPAQVKWMPVGGSSLTRAAARYAVVVDSLQPIDIVHLGIGDDGHTASWPPGDPVVESHRLVDMSRAFNGRRRMTLTPGPVNAARLRIVLATGGKKAAMIERWLAGDPSLPISRVRHTATMLIADRPAVSTVR